MGCLSPGSLGCRAEHQQPQLALVFLHWSPSRCTLTEPSCCTLSRGHAPGTALCAAKQTAGSILEGSLSLLLCRDDSFTQHYSAQVSSQEARVYWVHQLKAKITFISYSTPRAAQTKRDNRTVAKAKQWNLEDRGQPETALFQFPSIRRALMAFIGWWWPRLNAAMASSPHHHLTHGYSITHPASAQRPASPDTKVSDTPWS